MRGGERLEEVVKRAVDIFESEEHQSRLKSEAIAQTQVHADRDRADRISKLREKGVLLIHAEQLVMPLRQTDPLTYVQAQPPSRPLLVLSGGTGCGKTLAACWPLLESRGRVVLAADMAMMRPNTWWRDRDRVLDLERIGLLIIDDLGVEPASLRADFAQMLDKLLSKRAGNRLRTIITTNDNSDRFEMLYGGRVWSRIAESGQFFEINAPDLRMEGR